MMFANRVTVHDLGPNDRLPARGLTLLEAFTRLMALAERDYAFTRTARVMHLVMLPLRPDDPIFESTNTVDSHARHEIRAQVLAHGLGLFRVTQDEPRAVSEAAHRLIA